MLKQKILFNYLNNKRTKLNKRLWRNSYYSNRFEMYKFKPYRINKFITEKEDKHNIPSPRSGHKIICVKNNVIYCVGGFNPAIRCLVDENIPIFKEIWKFNLSTFKWTLILNNDNKAIATKNLASKEITMYKNNVLLAFGSVASSANAEIASNDCFLVTLNENNTEIEQLETHGQLPSASFGSATCIHNNYLYTIGGCSMSGYSFRVHRLNLIDYKWDAVYLNINNMKLSKGVKRHKIVCTNDYIFILGGRGSSLSSMLDFCVLPAFNLNNLQWEFIQTKPHLNSYPGPRTCHSCVQYNTSDGDVEAIISGGFYSSNIYYSDVWKINFRTMQWELLRNSQLPYPTLFHSSAISDSGCLYIFGGIIEYSPGVLKRTNEFYKIWIKIPKLSEISWDAVCFYSKNLDKFPRHKLIKTGIPRNIIDRIFC